MISGYFTKCAEAYLLADIEANYCSDDIGFQFICHFGIPEQIHTDHGHNFAVPRVVKNVGHMENQNNTIPIKN